MLDLDQDAVQLYRDALNEIQQFIYKLDLTPFTEHPPEPPSERAVEFAVRNDNISPASKIVEVCILYLAFFYRTPEYEEQQDLFRGIIKDIYGFTDLQFETALRYARKFSQFQTIYQSAVFNQALSAYLLQYYWNQEHYPDKRVPDRVQELQDNIAVYLGELPAVEDSEIAGVIDQIYDEEGIEEEDGYSLPHISDERQGDMAGSLSEKIESVATFIGRLRELYSPPPENENIDDYLDSIIME